MTRLGWSVLLSALLLLAQPLAAQAGHEGHGASPAPPAPAAPQGQDMQSMDMPPEQPAPSSGGHQGHDAAAPAPAIAPTGHEAHGAPAPGPPEVEEPAGGQSMSSMPGMPGMPPPPPPAGHAGHDTPGTGGEPGLLQLSPERQQMIGLKLGTVERRRLSKTIRAVGRVDYDEKRLVTVSPKIGGWIEDLYVDFTGRQVKKGEPLLTIFSPELLAAQEEYLVALKAKKELGKSRFPEVAGSGNTLAEAARRRLRLLDISEEQIRGLEKSGQARRTLTLFAPYSGVVVERQAYKGMNVMPGQALFKLADLSVVWINADIYEEDLPFIRQGQQASVSLSYLPGESLTGRVVYIYPFLDPKTRTVRVRLELPNPEGRLKPEMYAQVRIESDLGPRLVVPEGAVIDTGARQVVFVARQAGTFERREIRVGVKDENYVEVLSGLMAGDRVVTSANFLIDSESRFKEAVGGGGGHAGHAGHGN